MIKVCLLESHDNLKCIHLITHLQITQSKTDLMSELDNWIIIVGNLNIPPKVVEWTKIYKDTDNHLFDLISTYRTLNPVTAEFSLSF